MISSNFTTKTSSYHTIGLKDNAPLRSIDNFREDEVALRRQDKKVLCQDIAWNTFFLTFPMLLLTCVLFTFVFGYQIRPTPAPFEGLKGFDTATRLSDDAYFVGLNSTLLIFIASWMSSLAPMLAGFAIALAAYPVAGRLYDDTMRHRKEQLLTPFQLHLSLRLVTGSTWGALWNILLYRFGWGRETRNKGAALTSLCRITIMVVMLGMFVFAADTWLHITTETVSITQLLPVDSETAPYSLSLMSPGCTATNNTLAALAAAGTQCTMDPNSSLLTAGATVLQTLNNQSNAISALSDGPDPTIAYLAVNPSERSQLTDFSATTFGMRASCQPITSACNMSTDGTFAAWNCPDGSFATSFSEKSQFSWAFFNDEAMTHRVSDGVTENPFYYTVGNIMIPSAKPLHNLSDDPEILSDPGLLGIILLCKVEIFDIEYDVVKESVVRMTASTSNITVANVFEPAIDVSGFGTPNIQNAFNMAAAVATSADNLAEMFSLSFSKIGLSVGAGSVNAIPALAAQGRSSILVAKVLKAPLFLLVICNVAFIVMGCVLATIAIRSSPEAREVHARLSITGIVAYMFDGDTARAAGMQSSAAGQPEKLYMENYNGESTKRIGVGRGDAGGFEFKSFGSEVHASSIEIWRPPADTKCSEDGKRNSNRAGWI